MRAATPADPDLKRNIESVADYVARGGPAVEDLLRLQRGPEQAPFLHGGEGADYYRQLLQGRQETTMAPSQPPPPSGLPPSATAGVEAQSYPVYQKPYQESQFTAALDAAKLAARNTAIMMGATRMDSTAMQLHVPKPATPQLEVPRHVPLPSTVEVELATIMAGLEHKSDSEIHARSREWFHARMDLAQSIVGTMYQRLLALKSSQHKVHILSFVSDMMNQDIKNNTQTFIPIFKQYLCWILRCVYQAAAIVEKATVLAILHTWAERGIVTKEEKDEIHSFVTKVQHRAVGPQPQMQILALPAEPDKSLPVQTPETVPVGLLADMLKDASTRGKSMHTAFVPYRPLNPAFTPRSWQEVDTCQPYLGDAMETFYRLLRDDAEKYDFEVKGQPTRFASIPPPAPPVPPVPPVAPIPPTAPKWNP